MEEIASEQMITLSHRRSKFPVYEVKPENQDIKGALIIVHEVWGLTNHIKDVARRFAKEGYEVLAPNLISDADIEQHITPQLQKDLFDPAKRNKVQPQLRKIMAPIQSDGFADSTIAKLKICFDELWKRKGANRQVGVIGFCFGGTYSYQLAVNEPRLKAAVPFYGHANFDVNQLSKIECPILAFYGEKDEALITALPELTTNMKAAGVNFESTVYPSCGHAFFNDTNPFAYNEDAANDAWRKTLSFLAASL
jgi:carboxymethylenebutenolidase